MPLEHAESARVGPRRDLHDIFCAGLVELAKFQLDFFVPYAHDIERQRVEVHVEPERAVGSLHKGECTHLRITDRAQGVLMRRAPAQRTLECTRCPLIWIRSGASTTVSLRDCSRVDNACI
jgi:hypothetical protein